MSNSKRPMLDAIESFERLQQDARAQVEAQVLAESKQAIDEMTQQLFQRELSGPSGIQGDATLMASPESGSVDGEMAPTPSNVPNEPTGAMDNMEGDPSNGIPLDKGDAALPPMAPNANPSAPVSPTLPEMDLTGDSTESLLAALDALGGDDEITVQPNNMDTPTPDANPDGFGGESPNKEDIDEIENLQNEMESNLDPEVTPPVAALSEAELNQLLQEAAGDDEDFERFLKEAMASSDDEDEAADPTDPESEEGEDDDKLYEAVTRALLEAQKKEDEACETPKQEDEKVMEESKEPKEDKEKKEKPAFLNGEDDKGEKPDGEKKDKDEMEESVARNLTVKHKKTIKPENAEKAMHLDESVADAFQAKVTALQEGVQKMVTKHNETVQALSEENDMLRAKLGIFEKRLQEAALVSLKTASVNALMLEHTTTKQEKVQLVEAFSNVTTREEVKNLFEDFDAKLSVTKTESLRESVERKLNAKHGEATTLTESTTNPVIDRMQQLMKFNHKK